MLANDRGRFQQVHSHNTPLLVTFTVSRVHAVSATAVVTTTATTAANSATASMFANDRGRFQQINPSAFAITPNHQSRAVSPTAAVATTVSVAISTSFVTAATGSASLLPVHTRIWLTHNVETLLFRSSTAGLTASAGAAGMLANAAVSKLLSRSARKGEFTVYLRRIS